MRATLTTPRTPLISTADAKLFLRVDDPAEDALIDSMVQAATDVVAKYLRTNLGAETWSVELPAFQDRVALPMWPVTAITNIDYVDDLGSPQSLVPDDSVYIARTVLAEEVVRKSGVTWPGTQTENPGAVVYTVTAGIPDADVSDAVLGGIRLLTATMYDQRNEVVTGQSVAQLPYGVRNILAGYRRFT